MQTRAAQSAAYFQRINAVIDHVRANLDADLPLATLAGVAGFSPYHFHRVFRVLTGETISEMVTRLRLERAVALMRAAPRRTITEAALESGFQSIAVFSRTFKRRYGVSASRWDRRQPLKESKNGQAAGGSPAYTAGNEGDGDAEDAVEVRVRALPAQRLASIRVYDAYRQPSQVVEAYQRLIDWYRGHGGALDDTTLYGMSHDDPDITPLALCRFDWCLRVPEGWQAAGQIGITRLPACEIAAVRCQGGVDLEARAFGHLFRSWLPRSRYQPANLPAMEIYRRQPAELGWETYDMDCAVPIVPL